MVGCTFQGCQYDTDQALTHAMNPTLADHLAMLGLHNTGVHPPAQAQPAVIQNTQRAQPPKLILVEGKIEEAGWEAFTHAWENYKIAGNVQVGNEKALLAQVLGEVYSRVFGRLGVTAYDALME